jgi:hypothetical protein
MRPESVRTQVVHDSRCARCIRFADALACTYADRTALIFLMVWVALATVLCTWIRLPYNKRITLPASLLIDWSLSCRKCRVDTIEINTTSQESRQRRRRGHEGLHVRVRYCDAFAMLCSRLPYPTSVPIQTYETRLRRTERVWERALLAGGRLAKFTQHQAGMEPVRPIILFGSYGICVLISWSLTRS